MNNILTFTPPISIRFKLNFNFRFFWFLSLISIISLLAYYIIQVNSLTRERYLIGDYREKIAQFSKANGNLEINFSKSNSLVNIEKYLSAQNFKKTNRVRYIQLLEDQVVRK